MASGVARNSSRKMPMILSLMAVLERLIAIVRRAVALGGIGLLLAGSLSQAQTTSSLTLAWNPPSDASGIAGYFVYYGTSSGSYQQVINVGNTTTATISNLTVGQTYYFVVTVYNTVGFESTPSNQVSFTPGSVPKRFTGGGYSDLLWQYTPTTDYYIWLMQGTVHVSNIYLGRVPAPWRLAGTGDFKSDGKSGLFWENTVTGQRAIWFLNNGSFVSSISLPTVSTDWHIAGVGDFNGDGQADLVWENTVTGQHAIWFLNNGTFVSSIFLPTVSTDWHIAGAGDFNGDGQADLVWENKITGERAIWFLNNGVITSSIGLGFLPTAWEITEH